MWKWLRAQAECEALRTENAALRTELNELRHTLFREIDSNRTWTDTLVVHILAAARGQRPQEITVPRRSVLATRKEDEAADQPFTIIPEFSPSPEITEEMVQLRAREMYAQAQANGWNYDFEVLCETIRKNPDEYLSN